MVTSTLGRQGLLQQGYEQWRAQEGTAGTCGMGVDSQWPPAEQVFRQGWSSGMGGRTSRRGGAAQVKWGQGVSQGLGDGQRDGAGEAGSCLRGGSGAGLGQS